MRCSLSWLLSGAVFIGLTPAALSDNAPSESTVGSTISYGMEFIASYPNAVTALDIIQRIPGGAQIASSGGNSNARGFSNNDDRILIDGKRISGKSNDGNDALERITIEQIERIELIRGGNPDIKVSSQAAIINIVLREGSSKNAGSYETQFRTTRGGAAAIGAKISYGGQYGKLDYFLAAERFVNSNDGKQIDRELDADGNLLRQLNEVEDTDFHRYSVTANLGYNFDNGDVFRLNGKWERRKFEGVQPGTFFFPDTDGSLVLGGTSLRTFSDTRRPSQIEFSGDYEKQLGETFKLKLIGLYSTSDRRVFQAEDFDIQGPETEDDFQFITTEDADEKIGRASLTWTPNETHSLEFGSELTFNGLDSGLELFERVDDALVQSDIPGANIRIEETRNESFAIHSWALSPKWNIETKITTEYSEITQTGAVLDLSRDFFFIKPSTDIRYDISDRQQLQVSVRRLVSQLDFADFASAVSNDDEVIGSNTELSPEKRWQFETSYEYRLPNDQGSIKLGFRYDDFQDLIQRIETSPGVSGVGNVGAARLYRYSADGNLRLGFIGLENALIETKVTIQDSKAQNPFTGGTTRFNNRRNYELDLEYRHDLRSLGASYGIKLHSHGRQTFQDINETIETNGKEHFLDVFAETIILKGLIARFEVRDLLNQDRGRIRRVYENGVASGSQTSAVAREFHYGQRFFLTLKGTF
ncbi:MAG: outer membrane beta-barrel protein [Sphingomonadales bacterium]|jgi:outer membrane cobalamin receptor